MIRKLKGISRAVCLLVLLFTIQAWAGSEIAGRADSAALSDYINHFFMRVASYTKTPAQIDPDSANIRLAIDAALFDISVNPALSDACERKTSYVTGEDTVALWSKLPTDCIEVTSVSRPNPNGRGEIGLDKILKNEIGKNTSSTGLPVYYCVYGDSIYFDPNNQAGDTLFVFYRAYSNKMDADSVVSNVKLRYFNLAVELAIVNFYQGRRGADVVNVLNQANAQIAMIATYLGIKPESVLAKVQ